jgi:hypothetical protein
MISGHIERQKSNPLGLCPIERAWADTKWRNVFEMYYPEVGRPLQTTSNWMIILIYNIKKLESNFKFVIVIMSNRTEFFGEKPIQKIETVNICTVRMQCTILVPIMMTKTRKIEVDNPKNFKMEKILIMCDGDTI